MEQRDQSRHVLPQRPLLNEDPIDEELAIAEQPALAAYELAVQQVRQERIARATKSVTGETASKPNG